MVRGCDLQGLDNARLEELGVADDVHRLVIVECLNELMNGSSSLVSEWSGITYGCPLGNVAIPLYHVGRGGGGDGTVPGVPFP